MFHTKPKPLAIFQEQPTKIRSRTWLSAMKVSPSQNKDVINLDLDWLRWRKVIKVQVGLKSWVLTLRYAKFPNKTLPAWVFVPDVRFFWWRCERLWNFENFGALVGDANWFLRIQSTYVYFIWISYLCYININGWWRNIENILITQGYFAWMWLVPQTVW